MSECVDVSWDEIRGIFVSNILNRLGGRPSSLTFCELSFPQGYPNLDVASVTMYVLPGTKPPFAPADHPFPHGWTPNVQRGATSFAVTFDVPTRTAFWANTLGSLDNIRVRARCCK